MLKNSLLFFLLGLGTALLAFYNALFPVLAITAMTRFLALEGFFLLCVSLIIGPLAVLFPKKFCQLLETRRSVGLLAFAAIALHFLLVFAISYNFSLSPIFSGFPLLVALPALLLLAVIALFSNDYSMKKLGFFKWKAVQRLAYFVFALSLAHFAMEANGLFTGASGGKVFANLAELSMLALALAAILLQFAGFFRMKGLKKTAADKECVPD